MKLIDRDWYVILEKISFMGEPKAFFKDKCEPQGFCILSQEYRIFYSNI